jgi:hypothetical protein
VIARVPARDVTARAQRHCLPGTLKAMIPTLLMLR